MEMIVKNFVKRELLITSFNPDLTRIKGKILEIDKRERTLIFNSNAKLKLTKNIDKICNEDIFKVDVDVLYDDAGKIKFYLVQKIY